MSSSPNHSPPGILHEYAPHLVAFEFTTPTNDPKPNTLLFVGGLTDGLHTVPYVRTLAQSLTQSPETTWSVFNLLLSSSYNGFGTQTLDTDVTEIAQCIRFIRTQLPHKATGKIVLMGHSTGSQDVLHYLYTAPSDRPQLDGAIMQAPVSDREALLVKVQEQDGTAAQNEVRGAYEQLVQMARNGPADFLLPMDLLARVGLPEKTPVTAERFWSLASPESPQRPSADDLFSSDLTDERLRETFGKVAEQNLLKGKLMVLFSGADEYLPPWVDVPGLMGRWKTAANAGAREIWDDEESAAIEGASHNVSDVGQKELVSRVSRFLARTEKQT
ncbi:uncharacterized protein BP01DRAFT_395193 [Aspergillus saccharolyticus JOP 1030-1]|uniref:DUF1749-domain-containing protein n=1 Tax=Aspergillus saccharolyticus JOP 1030-1 TaxID=1450539 RepID=A0A318Z2V7_9EURO|nr:DUF1749-domain-containing protein [Aspergillus saccharolyticus JOP 1030-1]PYH41396.1 DUF1749-domain-containing protein [Aspergillus saccharolyticus JOP 1030-1]